ncbi:hypothetical protein UFOVP355_50 [uncultured Caudovirales phage]|uniref:Uncharacterized protein n=1 Tax=uncultured Caudovirales phage TaxID=2100421 RepID=A0A6J5NGM1_9CAUD|nr:hypothetical protein UFOVP355_50 [uncultured Caudovirales phage]CAB4156946.1 hypothetical protein UFOVP677_50 [uncultured Caudovirales phage]
MAYVQMSAANLRDTVRDITDLDTEDLPDSLLNLYLRDGYYRILDLEKRWSFLEKTFTFNTVAEQREYPISSFTADPISQVVSIVDNTNIGLRLDMVGHDMAEQTYVGSYDTSGDPLFYSIWEGKVHLFPKPNNVRTLTVRAYREPIDWINAEGNVDASANLHFALVYYACSRVYQRLEDTLMSGEYKRSFDEAVTLAAANISKPASHANLRLNAGQTSGRPTFNGWMQMMGKNLGQ